MTLRKLAYSMPELLAIYRFIFALPFRTGKLWEKFINNFIKTYLRKKITNNVVNTRLRSIARRKRLFARLFHIGYYRKNLTPLLDKLDIRESFTDNEGLILQKLADKITRPGMLICEIGSWKGHSSAYLAQVAQGQGGILNCIDTFKGSDGYLNTVHKDVKGIDILHLHRYNMVTLGFKCVKQFPTDSTFAASLFHNNEIDIIFMDADHHKEKFLKDLNAWLPKLREGGIICGHDCECKFTGQPAGIRSLVDNAVKAGSDFIADSYNIHPGVIKALYETFGDNYNIYPASRIWYWENK